MEGRGYLGQWAGGKHSKLRVPTVCRAQSCARWQETKLEIWCLDSRSSCFGWQILPLLWGNSQGRVFPTLWNLPTSLKTNTLLKLPVGGEEMDCVLGKGQANCQTEGREKCSACPRGPPDCWGRPSSCYHQGRKWPLASWGDTPGNWIPESGAHRCVHLPDSTLPSIILIHMFYFDDFLKIPTPAQNITCCL